MKLRRIFSILLLGAVTAGSMAAAAPKQQIEVGLLSFEPKLDGHMNEWQGLEPYRIAIAPAVEDDERNHTGEIEVELRVGRDQQKLYVAARWPDSAADDEFRPWQWRGNKYRRSKKRDDMFALRFALSGEYNRSMIADADYVVDVWVWSAGRSARLGVATDYRHRISLSEIEDAPEYETASGKTVYIDRIRDDGDSGYRTIRPGKSKTASRLPSIGFAGRLG